MSRNLTVILVLAFIPFLLTVATVNYYSIQAIWESLECMRETDKYIIEWMSLVDRTMTFL